MIVQYLIDLFTFWDWRFPVELLTNLAPKLLGVVDALVVHLIVLLHPFTVGLTLNPLRRFVNVRHDSEMFYFLQFPATLIFSSKSM